MAVQTGKIVRFHHRGFGFIAPDAGGGDVYFNAADALHERPRAGDRVSFLVEVDREHRGKSRAYDVDLIPLKKLPFVTGTIIRWADYGFIKPDDGSAPIFSAGDQLRAGYVPKPGDPVSYVADTRPDFRHPGKEQRIARLVGPIHGDGVP